MYILFLHRKLSDRIRLDAQCRAKVEGRCKQTVIHPSRSRALKLLKRSSSSRLKGRGRFAKEGIFRREILIRNGKRGPTCRGRTDTALDRRSITRRERESAYTVGAPERVDRAAVCETRTEDRLAFG